MNEGVPMLPNPPVPNRAVSFDPDICTGCNRCVDICRSNVLMPNPERGAAPIVLYPDECWYCANCVEECPFTGAITLVHPLHQSISVIWRRIETGEEFRLGMKDPSPPSDVDPPL